MAMHYKKSLICLSMFLLVFLSFGCAPQKAYRINPEFESHARNVTTPQLIPPDIKIYELSAGGVTELIDEWSAKGVENVTKSIIDELSNKEVEIKMVPLDEELKSELKEVQGLYMAVHNSIIMHTYDQYNLLPDKKMNFDYSIGPIDKILQRFNADSLIFAYGYDQISTGGRKALMVLGVLLGAATGVYAAPSSGVTAVSVALVDSSGKILWYNVNANAGSFDLRDEKSCRDLIKGLLSDFPQIKTR